MNTQTVTKNIQADKSINNYIAKSNYYSVDNFIKDAQTYIKAIKSGRMLCIIQSVSSSGMSRVIKFNSFEGTKTSGNYRQYAVMFEALGYKESKNRNGFTVHGCGMDMVFHTNYSIMHTFKRLGLITKEQCAVLAQQTPVIL